MLLGSFALAWMTQFASLLRGSCDWRLTALARCAVAFVLALALARASSAKLVFWRPAALWLRGAASCVSLLCQFYAFTRLPTAEVLTLSNTVPIWVAFLSWPLLGMAPSLAVWVAAAAGVGGVVLLQWPHLGGVGGEGLALGLSVLAALASAVAMLGLNRLKEVHPWAIVVHYSAFATLAVAGTLFVGPPPDLTPLATPSTLGLLACVGLCATVGQVCVTRAYTDGEPARMSVIGLTQIVFALMLDLAFSAALPHAVSLAGIALIFAPTLWVMLGRVKPAEALDPITGGRPPGQEPSTLEPAKG